MSDNTAKVAIDKLDAVTLPDMKALDEKLLAQLRELCKHWLRLAEAERSP